MSRIKIHDKHFEEMITPETIRKRVNELGQEIDSKFGDKHPLFLGVLNGAFVFMADLVRACPFPLELAFTQLSSYDGMKTSGRVKMLSELKTDIRGRHVILVEDIVDSGTTLYHFLPQLQEQAPASLSVASFVVKREAMQYNIPIDFLGFEIADRFVVGYGLDYDELGRNLPGLYQLKE